MLPGFFLPHALVPRHASALEVQVLDQLCKVKNEKRDGHTFKELHLDAIGHLLGDLVGDSWMLVMIGAGTPLALDGAPGSVFTTRIKLLCT